VEIFRDFPTGFVCQWDQMDQVPWTNTVCNGHFSPFYLLKLADTEWQKTSEDAKTGHVNVAEHFRSI
jgi:hypothetical protein